MATDGLQVRRTVRVYGTSITLSRPTVRVKLRRIELLVLYLYRIVRVPACTYRYTVTIHVEVTYLYEYRYSARDLRLYVPVLVQY